MDRLQEAVLQHRTAAICVVAGNIIAELGGIGQVTGGNIKLDGSSVTLTITEALKDRILAEFEERLHPHQIILRNAVVDTDSCQTFVVLEMPVPFVPIIEFVCNYPPIPENDLIYLGVDNDGKPIPLPKQPLLVVGGEGSGKSSALTAIQLMSRTIGLTPHIFDCGIGNSLEQNTQLGDGTLLLVDNLHHLSLSTMRDYLEELRRLHALNTRIVVTTEPNQVVLDKVSQTGMFQHVLWGIGTGRGTRAELLGRGDFLYHQLGGDGLRYFQSAYATSIDQMIMEDRV